MNKTGFHKCSYCGDERKAEDMKQAEITFRDRDPWTGKAFINKRETGIAR